MEPSQCTSDQDFLESGRVVRIYLDEFSQNPLNSLGIDIIQFIASSEEIADEATQANLSALDSELGER